MIVGHSGSGKSTLMNMLGLLDICTSGEYLIDGKMFLTCRTMSFRRYATKK